MNKFITKVAKLVLGLSLAAGVGVAVGSKKASRVDATSISSNFTDKNLSVGSGELAWTASKSASSFESASPARGVQFGAAIGEFTLTATISGSPTITAVDMVVSTNATAGLNSIKVKVGSTYFECDGEETYSMPKSNGQTPSFIGSASGTITIEVNDANKSVYFKSISVTYGSGGQSKVNTTTTVSATDNKTELDGTLSNPADSVQLIVSVEDANSNSISSPDLSYAATGNDLIVTVSSDGLVSAVGYGTSTITVSYSGDSTHNGSQGSIEISVVDPNATTMTEGTNGSAAKVVINQVEHDAIKVGTGSAGGNMTISVPSGTTQLSFYAAAWNGVTNLSLNLTAPSGITISPSSVALIADSGISSNSPFTLAGNASDYLHTVVLSGISSKTTITLTSSTNKRFVVWDAESSSAVPPTYSDVIISLGSLTGSLKGSAYIDATAEVTGSNGPSQTVTWYITETNSYATTTSITGLASINSSGRITFQNNGTVYVWALAADGSTHNTTSVAATASGLTAVPGTVDEPYTVAQARAAIDAGSGTSDVYATGIVKEIVTPWGTNNYQNITFNIVDNPQDNNFLQAYRAIGTDAADVAIGDTVVVYGDLTKHDAIYEFAQGCEVTSLEHPQGTEHTVSFDSDGGSNVSDIGVIHGSFFNFPDAGTKSGFIFTGWTSDNGTHVYGVGKASPVVNDDIEYTGVWQTEGTSSDPYTVAEARAAIDSGLGVMGAYVEGLVSEIVTSYTENNGVTFNMIDDGGTDTLEAYKCKGTDADTVDEGDTVKVSGDLILYNNSKYEVSGTCTLVSVTHPQVTTYTITYNANGGQGNPPTSTTGSGTVTLASSGNELTKDGYTLDGWGDVDHKDASTAQYALGASYTLSADITLYAHWTQNVGPTPSGDSLTFDFEAEGAYRSSGSNSYTGSNSYSQNGYNISLTYADSVGSGSPLSGSYHIVGRIAKNTTNSPTITIGPLAEEDKVVTQIDYKTKGVAAMTMVVETSDDNSSWTTQQTLASMPTSATDETIDNLELDGDGLYIRWTVSVESSTGSNRDFNLDDVVLTLEDVSSTPTTSIVSGTFEYQDKQSLYVDDAGTMVVNAPEGCTYLTYAGDENYYFIADDQTFEYDSQNGTMSFDFVTDSSAHADVEITFYWYGDSSMNAQTYHEVTETIQIVNPTGLADARAFASDINACCGSGDDMSDLWDMLAGDWAGLSNAAKDFLRDASFTVSGSGANTVVTKSADTHTELAAAMSRYDFMVTNYGMTNFMSRSIPQGSHVSPLAIFNVNDTNTVAIIVIISLVSVTAIGGYFFLKKRREQN